MIAELTTIALALIAGFALALLIDRRAAGALLAGEALLFGLALCGLLLVIVPWSRTMFLLTLAIITTALYAVAVRAKRTPDERSTQHTALSTVLNVATCALLLGYALFATAAPLWEFDFLVDWGLKARAFFHAGGIDWRFLEAAWYRGTHPDYPPLLPLIFDVISVLRGSWTDRYLGLTHVAFAGAMLLIVYRLAVEELRSDLPAAFIALAMLPLAASPWIGIAEAPFAAYATASLLLIRKGSIAPGAVMLGLAALTKNEGAALIVAVALALLMTRRMRDVPRLWPAILLPLPWWIARGMHHLATDVTSGDAFARIVQHATDATLVHAIASYSLGKPLFWIGLVAGIAVTFRRLERFVVTALAIQLVFYIGAYLATPHDVGWHVQWSWERLISHLTPAITFLVLMELLGTSVGRLFDRLKRGPYI